MDCWNQCLCHCFLFEGMSAIEVAAALALAAPQHRLYRRGEIICCPDHYQRALYVLLRGECEVLKGDGATRMVMNTIGPGGSFGVVSLFSRKHQYPTTVEARRETELLLLTGEDVERMMAAHSKVSVNLLRFLTDRVEFLGDRLAELTEPTVERKLASHLLKCWQDGGQQPISLNRKRTAELLHCGRASLYRALDALEQQKLISWQEDNLLVVSPEGLERMDL